MFPCQSFGKFHNDTTLGKKMEKPWKKPNFSIPALFHPAESLGKNYSHPVKNNAPFTPAH